MFTQRWLSGMFSCLLVTMFVMVPDAFASGGMASSETWLAEYFDNRYLGGQPVYGREHQAIDFDWGYGSPSPGLGEENFSVRFVRILDVSGRYRFTVTCDDGARLWVGDQLVIDEWTEHPAQTFSAVVHVTDSVPVKLEYFEASGLAEVHLAWAAVEQPAPPPGTGGPGTACVNVRYLNVRQGPGVGYDVIGVAREGTVVMLTHRNQDASWVRAILPSGTQGWLNASFLASERKPFTYLPPFGGGEYAAAVVNHCYWLNVRSGPGVRYGVLATIRRGTVVTLTSTTSPDGRWTRIVLPSGRLGWANNYFLAAS